MLTAIQLCGATVGMEGNAPVGAQKWQSEMADAEHSRQVLVEAGTVAGWHTAGNFAGVLHKGGPELFRNKGWGVAMWYTEPGLQTAKLHRKLGEGYGAEGRVLAVHVVVLGCTVWGEPMTTDGKDRSGASRAGNRGPEVPWSHKEPGMDMT